VFGLTF